MNSTTYRSLLIPSALLLIAGLIGPPIVATGCAILSAAVAFRWTYAVVAESRRS